MSLRLKLYDFKLILSWQTSLEQWLMGLLAWTTLFGRFTATPNPQHESRKIDLHGYHHPNHFSILVAEMVLFSRIAAEASNEYANILIIIL